MDDIIIICWGDHTQKVVDEGKSTDKNLKIMKDILGDLQLGMNKNTVLKSWMPNQNLNLVI